MKELSVGLLLLFPSLCCAADSGLRLEARIPMPAVKGRIDHLAIDVPRKRLFVAALGNNSVEILDLAANARIHSIGGLSEPQGIAYLASRNLLFVANGGDGSVRIFDASSWKMVKSLAYGDDADNLRLDPGKGSLWVGYGKGALAEFLPDGSKVGEIPLDAHPESFQLEARGARIFVNLPGSRKIAVIDRKTRSVAGSWSTGGLLANYPMALDETSGRLFVATRTPARLLVLETTHGKQAAALPAVGDCDDVFYDARRHRIYVIGGEGAISVYLQRDPDRYEESARIPTAPGARTGFFSPELDRLYVAVRQHGAAQAEVRVYAPAP